jgi:endonuclease V-like protein UPF0215 family
MKRLDNPKKEIRILGLDASNPNVTIGAIVRGGLYLDGVLTFSGKINSSQLAREITKTKYFPELRIIMVHDPNGKLNPRAIGRITRLPSIDVLLGANDRAKGARGSPSKHHREGGSSGISPAMKTRILELTKATGRMPEPVRIARLLAKLQVFGRHLQDKR